jgi:hypothetical protein
MESQSRLQLSIKKASGDRLSVTLQALEEKHLLQMINEVHARVIAMFVGGHRFERFERSESHCKEYQRG